MRRILSAIVLIPASLLIVFFAPRFFYLIGIGLIGTLCLYEYFRLMRTMDIRVRSWFGYIAFWVLLIVLHLRIKQICFCNYDKVTVSGIEAIGDYRTALDSAAGTLWVPDFLPIIAAMPPLCSCVANNVVTAGCVYGNN